MTSDDAKQRLPDRASDLIELAVADLERVEAASDVYVVDMELWHASTLEPETGGYRQMCHVCLAGAVMAGTLGVPPIKSIMPSYFSIHCKDRDTERKLLALDEFRRGEVLTGVDDMYGDRGDVRVPVSALEILGRTHIPDYEKDPVGFRREMRALARRLREAGL